ncbi:hypothetical protein [Chryseobacterium sp.]|uniref:hypothetical protein n=1 Tax=Chryseobacterium sp. TaxID=1871047 RepID=UPI00321B3EEF
MINPAALAFAKNYKTLFEINDSLLETNSLVYGKKNHINFEMGRRFGLGIYSELAQPKKITESLFDNYLESMVGKKTHGNKLAEIDIQGPLFDKKNIRHTVFDTSENTVLLKYRENLEK